MQNITTVAGFRDAIQVLEVEQASKGQLLKEQLSVVYESLMPVNILRNTLRKFFGKSDMIDNLSGPAMGAASGLLMKKIFIGKSGDTFKRLMGSILQMGISKIISQNSGVIKSFIQSVFQYFFHKKNEFQ